MTGNSNRFLDWRYINEIQINTLETVLDEDEIKRLLRIYFNIHYKDEIKNIVATDFHFYNYAFCKERAFDSRRTSTYLSIMNDIFIKDSMTSSGKTRKLSYEYFEKLILIHSVELPPNNTQIFKEIDFSSIIDYSVESYFRHFNLYSYIFSKQERYVNVKQSTVGTKSNDSNQQQQVSISLFDLVHEPDDE